MDKASWLEDIHIEVSIYRRFRCPYTPILVADGADAPFGSCRDDTPIVEANLALGITPEKRRSTNLDHLDGLSPMVVCAARGQETAFASPLRTHICPVDLEYAPANSPPG